jgi:hypothetical protein
MAAGRDTNRPDYFAPGHYLVALEALKEAISSKDQQTVFVLTARVLQSDQPSVPPGSMRSQVIKPNTKAPGAWANDLHSFMAAVCRAAGLPPHLAEDEATYQRAFAGDGTAFAGLQMKVEATERPTQSGGVWTRIVWRTVEEGPEIRPQAPAPQPPPGAPNYGPPPIQPAPQQPQAAPQPQSGASPYGPQVMRLADPNDPYTVV